MSNGFLPEQPTTEEEPQKVAELPPELQTPEISGEVDEYAQAEREARKEFAEQEQEQGFLEAAMEEVPADQAASDQDEASQAQAAPVKDEVTVEVENILQDGLQPLFQSLPPDAKQRFQKKGVEVSVKISDMVRNFRVNAKKVVLLIREWLLTIPGVNKFFMEQEAKIKTDRILQLEEARRRDQENNPL